MLPEGVIRELSQLNRQRPAGQSSSPVTCRPGPAEPPRTAGCYLPDGFGKPSFADGFGEPSFVDGCESATPWGPHWLIERSLDKLWPAGGAWMNHLTGTMWTRTSAGVPHPELERLRHGFPTQIVFLDLETCGFAGSMIFLVGILHGSPHGWRLSQLLARHYAEEKAILHSFWQIAADHPVLVTFNGKSFDWPMVRDRSILHHLTGEGNKRSDDPLSGAARPRAPRPDGIGPLLHIDLLHHARRRWRHQLPDCRLQTLELSLCGRRRRGDIAGQRIPSAYHDFVRTGDAWQIRSILHHNALDLITLLQLSLMLASHQQPGSRSSRSA